MLTELRALVTDGAEFIGSQLCEPWRIFSHMAKPRPPSLPDGVRVYAIGDVHGRVDLLEQVFARIDADLANDSVQHPIHVLLGDYIDRGPSSREVLDRLVERGRFHDMICLKGNHESFILRFLRDPSALRGWRHLGGLETLISYGLDPSSSPSDSEKLKLAKDLAAALPDSHRELLEKLESSFVCGDFFFVHAGVRPGVSLAKQREKDLLWIRNDFLRSNRDFGKFIVHGHTPVLAPDMRSNRINIDTGAYETGRLTCLAIELDAMSVL